MIVILFFFFYICVYSITCTSKVKLVYQAFSSFLSFLFFFFIFCRLRRLFSINVRQHELKKLELRVLCNRISQGKSRVKIFLLNQNLLKQLNNIMITKSKLITSMTTKSTMFTMSTTTHRIHTKTSFSFFSAVRIVI